MSNKVDSTYKIVLTRRRLHQRAELCRLDQQDHFRLEQSRQPEVSPPLDRRRRGRASTQTRRPDAARPTSRPLSSTPIVLKKKNNKMFWIHATFLYGVTMPAWPEYTMGQFHQPFGVKCKCAGTQHLAQKDAIKFNQLNCTQLY